MDGPLLLTFQLEACHHDHSSTHRGGDGLAAIEIRIEIRTAVTRMRRAKNEQLRPFA
jgi:hypothetical protein